MQVILLQDVAKIGRKNDVVKVPDGYGMNKLIPQKLAKPATSENLKQIQQQSSLKEDSVRAELSQFDSIAEALQDKTINLTAKANPEGTLFEAVKSTQISDLLSEIADLTVPATWVVIDEQIKTAGEHSIKLQCQDKKLPLTLVVSG